MLSKVFINSVLLLISFSIAAQKKMWKEYESMPKPVINNAVTSATVNGAPFIYSFSGLDQSKDCGKNHIWSFRFDTSAKSWEVIVDLHDPKSGKIAAAASTVKNKIYIIGGYHVSNSCNERSSKKASIYDPEANTYFADGADIQRR